MSSVSMTPELASSLVRQAERMNREDLANLQEERLHFLVAHARKHSPFLAEKYRNLPEKFSLKDIPVLERAESVAHFDNWICDRDVTTPKLDDYLANSSTLTQDFLGRYRVLSTSGSTAAPLRIVRDMRHNQINAALLQSRFWGGSKLGSIAGLKQPWPRACAITAGGGRHSSYLSFLRMQKAYKDNGMGNRAMFCSIETPLPELIEKLNSFQPEILGSYPSILQILAKAQKSGKLAIRPLALCSSAEYLSPAALSMLEDVFQCPVMDNYCSTEGGEAAMLCKANHLHLNSDWIILEPVDELNNPVKDRLSDGILLTNLANLVQPIIRYRISDRARLWEKPCSCGSPFPVLEIEGRKEDILEFPTRNGSFFLSPPVLMVASLHIPGCVACQFIQHSPTELEVRCESLTNADHATVAKALVNKTTGILQANEVEDVRVSASDQPPLRGNSGKLRAFIKDFD